MKIIIGADVIVDKNKKTQIDFNKPISSDLKEIWEDHDFRIFNIEGPITDSETKNKKSGPNLRMSKDAIGLIKNLKPSLVTLANNHIFDYMEEGVNDTVALLEKHEIPFIGLKGNDKFSEYHILEKGNVKVGVYAVCENEFLTNESGEFGAIGFNYSTIGQTILQIKRNVDCLIILYHGGKEHYQYATPDIKNRLHMLVDFGADFVVAQHSHCIGIEEIYKEKTILYGQGNFVFPETHNIRNELWNKGFLVSLTIIEAVITVNYIPIKQTDKGTQLMNKNENESELIAFKERNLRIQDETKLKELFNNHIEKEMMSRMYKLFGYSRLTTRLDRHIFKSFFLKRKIKNADIPFILNMFRCEAHSECTIKALEKMLELHPNK